MKRETDKLKESCKNTRLGTNMKTKQVNAIKTRGMKNSVALKNLLLKEDISEIVQTPIDFNCVNSYMEVVTSTQIKKPPAIESTHASVQPCLNISEQSLQSPHKEVVEKPRVFNFMRYSLVNNSVCDQEEVQENEIIKDVVTPQLNNEEQIASESNDTKTPEKNEVNQTLNSPPKRAKLREEERMKIPFSMRYKAAQLSSSRTKLARDKKQESNQGQIPHKTTSATAFKDSTEKLTLTNSVYAFDNPAVPTFPRAVKYPAIASKLPSKTTAIIKTQQTQIAKQPLSKTRPIIERITSKVGANAGAIKKGSTI
ncbi:uncharacterized protein ACN2A1_012647 [Glossina fuscipes fuscipes]